MTTENDLLGAQTPIGKRARKVRDLGPLHALLIRGLPDWVEADGMLRTYDLSRHLGITYQALYKIFERDRIAPKRITAIIRLSEATKSSGEFTPLTYQDFLDFL